MFRALFYFTFSNVNALLELARGNEFLTLPATFTVNPPSYEIITVLSEAEDPNFAIEIKIENFEPEREICFDDFLDIRDYGGEKASLLWGICTKQLREKIIVSCGSSIQYQQRVAFDSARMRVSIRAIEDDGRHVKPFQCLQRELKLLTTN